MFRCFVAYFATSASSSCKDSYTAAWPFLCGGLVFLRLLVFKEMCVCARVCVRERERERERAGAGGGGWLGVGVETRNTHSKLMTSLQNQSALSTSLFPRQPRPSSSLLY